MRDILLSFRHAAPPEDDFIFLRKECGWGELSTEIAKKTLTAGLANVTVFEGSKTIGFGRVIGDGVIYFYVQDLIVREGYQGMGLGTEMLKNLVEQTVQIAAPGASIGLMSTKGKEEFYEKLGFTRRPNDDFGSGMTHVLNISSNPIVRP